MVKCTIGKNNFVVFRLILRLKVLNWKGSMSNFKCVSSLSICLMTEKSQLHVCKVANCRNCQTHTGVVASILAEKQV
jgi:hypothetical protein